MNQMFAVALPTCHGCSGCLYSAPGGQAWLRVPHSRCRVLNVNVPMVLGDHGKWLGSKVPADCPIYAPATPTS